jgi:hypothetical protein
VKVLGGAGLGLAHAAELFAADDQSMLVPVEGLLAVGVMVVEVVGRSGCKG